MPEFTYQIRTINDPSQLTNGFHPAYLMAIQREDIPEGWKSYKPELSKDENYGYRWSFLVWERPDDVTTIRPERQSAVSSKAFVPKGKQNPASKAYLWTMALLNREIVPGERINLDPMLPLPCIVDVERKEQYANIIGLRHHAQLFPQGMTLLSPEFKIALLEALHAPAPEPVAPAPYAAPAQPQIPRQPPVTHPQMASWGTPVPAHQGTLPGTPSPTKGW